MTEYSYEIWNEGKRLGVAKDDNPVVALHEAIKAVDGKEGFEIYEVRKSRVWPQEGK